MIYTRLSRTGEIVDVKAHGGGDISEVYGGIGETNPIYYKSRTITGTLPLSYKALGKPLSDYLIEGNTIQSGTPSPESPVDVVGCGVWDETYQSYKLTPTVTGTEHPIYLGQVETTRRIKKLVLTGVEAKWVNVSGNAPYRIELPDIVSTSDRNSVLFLSDHYLAVSNSTSWAQYNACVSWAFSGNANVKCLQFRDTNQATLADFKSYLAAQYANGTPVTVWYVLANPETGIVNEPLNKIGDYADAITMAQAEVTIPTSDGGNTISFGTTVKPSEVSITGNIKEC